MKKRLPRKIKKKVKKKIGILSGKYRTVLNQAFMDELTWGISGVHVNKETGEIKNVPINEVLNLRHKHGI